jgi:hypothetical protein
VGTCSSGRRSAEEAELLLIEPSGTPNTGDSSTATERVVI